MLAGLALTASACGARQSQAELGAEERERFGPLQCIDPAWDRLPPGYGRQGQELQGAADAVLEGMRRQEGLDERRWLLP